MPDEYTLAFDLSSYEALDDFALLADQKYNLGDRGDWFNHFRGGLYGLYARVLGVRINYHAVHSWALPVPFMNSIQRAEYHLSSILFNMDSAIECMVFALNALGYIADSSQFKDVTSEKDLKKISPYNILGLPPNYSNGFVSGYDSYYSSLKSYWHQNRDLILTIFEQHDVSKHRQAIFTGGKMRDDPPLGFFEKLKLESDQVRKSFVSPWEEIILTPQPKTPWRQRQPKGYMDIDKLENIAERFCTFINMCGVKALEDAKSNIQLNCYELKH